MKNIKRLLSLCLALLLLLSLSPATADTSNLPLWSLLLLSFTALALITKKKKA